MYKIEVEHFSKYDFREAFKNFSVNNSDL
jgi:hypothetical protein